MAPQVDLPFTVDSNGASAELDSRSRSLRVGLPFRPFSDVLDEVSPAGCVPRGSRARELDWNPCWTE